MNKSFSDIQYGFRNDAVRNNLTEENLMETVVRLMTRVESYRTSRKKLMGIDKKIIVLDLLLWFIDDCLEVGDNTRSAMQELIATAVPVMIEAILFASKNAKALKVFSQKNCSCLPF